MALQFMKVSDDSTLPCLLDPGPQDGIKHTSQPGGQPNVRPSVLVPKQA